MWVLIRKKIVIKDTKQSNNKHGVYIKNKVSLVRKMVVTPSAQHAKREKGEKIDISPE